MTEGATLAVVTGASSGIGLALARCAAADGCDLVIVAEGPDIVAVGDMLRQDGVHVTAVEADLGTQRGLDTLWERVGDRRIDRLMANAGRGLGHAFLEQDWQDIEDMVHLNVTGTTSLLHRAIPRMRAAGQGRILITGSAAGRMPGAFQAVHSATGSYLDTLSWGIREELKGSGVTVTCLMPGVTETGFFDRAHMRDTPVGEGDKDDPAMVAREGYEAMLRGASGVTPGFMNKVRAAFAGVIPDSALARMQGDMAEPKDGPHD